MRHIWEDRRQVDFSWSGCHHSMVLQSGCSFCNHRDSHWISIWYTVVPFVHSNMMGSNLVPLCELSQNGCHKGQGTSILERPQVQYLYFFPLTIPLILVMPRIPVWSPVSNMSFLHGCLLLFCHHDRRFLFLDRAVRTNIIAIVIFNIRQLFLLFHETALFNFC